MKNQLPSALAAAVRLCGKTKQGLRAAEAIQAEHDMRIAWQHHAIDLEPQGDALGKMTKAYKDVYDENMLLRNALAKSEMRGEALRFISSCLGFVAVAAGALAAALAWGVPC